MRDDGSSLMAGGPNCTCVGTCHTAQMLAQGRFPPLCKLTQTLLASTALFFGWPLSSGGGYSNSCLFFFCFFLLHLYSVFQKPCRAPVCKKKFEWHPANSVEVQLSRWACILSAHICGLSKFEVICSDPVRPHLQSSGVCTSVHDWHRRPPALQLLRLSVALHLHL